MKTRLITQWLFIFTVLGLVTAWIVAPRNGTLAFAQIAEASSKAIVFDDEREEKTLLRRLSHRLSARNTICAVTDEQAEELAERFVTENETLTINGKDVDFLKVQRNKVSTGKILHVLRDMNPDIKCMVVPAKSWYY